MIGLELTDRTVYGGNEAVFKPFLSYFNVKFGIGRKLLRVVVWSYIEFHV